MPRSTHYGNNYWSFKSKKTGILVECFSNLEFFNALTLEMDPTVEHYCTQPYTADVHTEDGIEHVTFDVYIKYMNGRELFSECKYTAELDEENVSSAALRSRNQIRLEEKWCHDNHFDFAVVTEKDVFKGKKFLENILFLYGHYDSEAVNISEMNAVYDKIVEKFSKQESMQISEMVEEGILDEKRVYQQISWLYARGYISMRILSRPLDYKTEVVRYGKL